MDTTMLSSTLVLAQNVTIAATLASDAFAYSTPAKVWGIGLLFVTLISSCAAVGIVLMPCLSKRTYNVVLTYFVGLGVGSLSGSAIFHLLPQAFDLVDPEVQNPNQPGHAYLSKSWVAIFGVFLFFLVDKFLKLGFEFRKTRKSRLNSTSSSDSSSSDNSSSNSPNLKHNNNNNNNNNNNHSTVSPTKNKKRSVNENRYVMAASNAADVSAATVHAQHANDNDESNTVVNGNGILANVTDEDDNDNGLMQKNSSANPILGALTTTKNKNSCGGKCQDKNEPNGTVAMCACDKDARKARAADDDDDDYKIELGCGHGHHHGGPVGKGGKNMIATVAWMIIFGDGLHNFIDGLSIGAAFCVNILSGISVSVAVLCEEFPHELGDVAILVASGMSMRQALLYNLLSAATCYAGFVIGVLVGELKEASYYIFALAAGCFLYISLGNMISEMNKEMERSMAKSLRKATLTLILHSAGITTGLVTMFLMAYYGGEIDFS